MDFMTIDTMFGRRFYLLIILKLKSRKIVKWGITENPSREYVRQQIKKIISDFIDYYNFQRMHQGIHQIPGAEIEDNSGVIRKMKILSGLHHHYFRSSM